MLLYYDYIFYKFSEYYNKQKLYIFYIFYTFFISDTNGIGRESNLCFLVDEAVPQPLRYAAPRGWLNLNKHRLKWKFVIIQRPVL